MTPKCCSIDSERRNPGVIASAATPCGFSSAAMLSASILSAAFTVCDSGLPPAAEQIAFRHLDDEAAPVADHERRRVLRGDDVRRERLSQDRVGILQVDLPEATPLPHHRVFAGNAVDEHVERGRACARCA